MSMYPKTINMLNVTLCFSCVHVHSIWKRSFVSVTSNVYICGERVVFVHNLIYCCQRVFALFHLSQQLSLPMAFLPNCLQCVCPPPLCSPYFSWLLCVYKCHKIHGLWDTAARCTLAHKYVCISLLYTIYYT